MWEHGPHQSVTDAGESEDASTINFQLKISISILKGHLDFSVLHCTLTKPNTICKSGTFITFLILTVPLQLKH